MEFTLSEEHRMIQHHVRQFMVREIEPVAERIAIREGRSDPHSVVDEVLKETLTWKSYEAEVTRFSCSRQRLSAAPEKPKGGEAMAEFKKLGVLVLTLCCILGVPRGSLGDVAPGDVIDKSNWQKAEDLLPESVLNWVKKGDGLLKIDEIKYDQREFIQPWVTESMTGNVGKYAIDEEGQIIHAKDGKEPEFILGFPFPRIDPDDPRAGPKIMYNKCYHSYSFGNLKCPWDMRWVGRSTGCEREIGCTARVFPFQGYPEARELSNPKGMLKYTLFTVESPFDIAGTAVMLWRYRGARDDSNFGYLPAIRRVRRMSPANRSDSFVGSDCCVDDAWGFDGKVSFFDWKLIRKQEMLVPFVTGDVERAVPNPEGGWRSTKDIKPVSYGFETEGWQGAPWFPVSVIWVKKPAWVIRATPKDPYYNYGTIEYWVNADIFFPAYSVINDRAGTYWKTFLTGMSAFESDDKKMKFLMISMQHMVDDRTQHSSYVEACSPRNHWAQWVEMDPNDFSLAGFQKFCK